MERVDISSCIKNSEKFQKAMIKRKEQYGNGTKIMTDESKKKISEGLKRYYENNSKNGVSDTTLSAIQKALNKPIIQYTKDGALVREYPSIKSADESTGVKRDNIYMVLSGKTKLAGGFIWKYKTPTVAALLTVVMESATVTDSGPEPADDPVQSQATP